MKSSYAGIVISLFACLSFAQEIEIPPDPTGAVSVDGVYTPPALATLEGAFADAVALEDDPRIARWIMLQQTRDYQELISATEADIRTNDPHPYSPHIWAWTQWALGDLTATTLPEIPVDLSEPLKFASRVFAYVQMERYDLVAGMADEALARTTPDFWADFEIKYAALDFGNTEASRLLGKRLTIHYPNSFQPAWFVGTNATDGNSDAIMWLAENPSLAKTPAAALIRWVAAHGDLEFADRLHMLELWQEVSPNDPNALRRSGYQLENLQRYDEALAYFKREHAVYPFRDAAQRIARVYAAKREFTLASQTSSDWTEIAEPEDTRDGALAAIQVKMLVHAGEYGRARDVGFLALDISPDDTRLRVELGRALMGEEFPNEAIDVLEPVLQTDPSNYTVAEPLISSLIADNRVQEALRVISAFRAADGADGPSLLNHWINALVATKKWDKLDEVLIIAQRAVPNAYWVQGNIALALSNSGRKADAYALIRQLVLTDATSAWRIEQLVKMGNAAEQTEDAVAVLEALERRYPYQETIWDELLKLGTYSSSNWSRAIEKNPLEGFPIVAHAWREYFADPGTFSETIAGLDSEISRLQTVGAAEGELAMVYYARASITDRAIRDEHSTDLTLVPQALNDLDTARKLGISEKSYWYRRSLATGLLGPSPEQSFAAIKRAELLPDQLNAHRHLYNKAVEEYAENRSTAAIYFSRMVERKPRDPKRLSYFALYQNKYGGSPVVALAALEKAKRWNPDYDVSQETEYAYSRLGAHKRYYETEYNSATAVGRSSRYLQWFDSARHRASQEKNTIKNLDLNEMRVVVRRPDGIEEERQYHSVFGRLIYFRIGAFEVWVDYTSTGHLSNIRLGNNTSLKLEYGDARGTELSKNIVRTVVDDRTDVRYTYSYETEGPSRPIEMEVVGFGRLEVSYDENDGIEQTKFVPIDNAATQFAFSKLFAVAMQKVLSYKNIVDEIEGGDLSGFDLDDGALDALWEKVWVEDGEYNAFSTHQMHPRMAVSSYLIDRVGDHPDYADQAELELNWVISSVVESTKEALIEPAVKAEMQLLGINSVRLWKALMHRTRPDGLALDKWEEWTGMRDWVLAQESAAPEVIEAKAGLRADMDNAGLRPLSQNGWLAKTDITNPGFWRNVGQHDVFPSAFANNNLRMRDILVRRNGDVVVASNLGLAVLRRGYWEWFAYDKSKGQLSDALDYLQVDGGSNFSSLAEDERGRLWLGSRVGLMMLAEDYNGELLLWRGQNDGLFDGAVSALAGNGNTLAIAGDAGLVFANLDTLNLTTMSGDPVNRVRATSEGFLVIGRNALWWQGLRSSVEITPSQVTDAILGPEGQTLFVLSGKSLQSVDFLQALASESTLAGVVGHEAIPATAPPDGLALIEISRGVPALAVLFDKGGAVLGEGGFENFSKPNSIRPVGIRNAHDRDGRLFMITSEGISSVVWGEAHYPVQSRVYDLLSDPELQVTFVATGHDIRTVDHRDTEVNSSYFSGANARILEMAPDGALITHDDDTILRFARGSFGAQELFATYQTRSNGRRQAEIRDILAAQDGSVWAVAGASVFHWQEGSDLKEFSMYDESKSFPVNSDMLHALHETADGRILLVASDEGHRSYKTAELVGGLFEYTGTGFTKTSLDVLGSWFLTSHTQINEDTAIVGTVQGFARMRGGKLDEFNEIEEPSYMALRELQPALYRGTDGTRLDDDLWLFGSAGGLVALKGSQWFYPDRLNWILPGRDYANYGSRAIHAVASDASGKIYIGTDWGLTVYDPGGAGAQSFLISESRSDFAFSAFEQARMNEVNDILLEALPSDSKAGKLANTYRKNRQKIVALEESLSKEIDHGEDFAQLKKELRRTQQRDISILAKLEQQEPLLFNMLQLNPLDLRALGKKLPEDVVIVQYLPTETALYINVVSEERAEMIQVAVTLAELDQVIALVTSYLTAQARGQVRGFDAPEQTSANGLKTKRSDYLNPSAYSDEAAKQALAWLYDKLLRPVEHSVGKDSTIVISPAGSLSYLPFAALIRDIKNNTPEYAVQHFDLATAPSLYALNMLINTVPSMAFSHLVFGDPDGSLKHARAEAEAIANVLSDDQVELRIGDEATYNELISYAPDARFVHLAMHGKLDHLSPKDSYLLLAEDHRLSIPQIMTLPLGGSELVFLSACETALGRDGLEFRTIAHAFAHAGAPAIVATLWQVEDEATRRLAEGFYKAKVDGASNAEALGTVQREMIASGGKHAKPGYWAAALVMGKP